MDFLIYPENSHGIALLLSYLSWLFAFIFSVLFLLCRS